MNEKSSLILYVGIGCPYCSKVLSFIDDNHIDLVVKNVWVDNEAKQELIALTGKTQVPCLKIGDQGMLESDDIIQFLDAHF